MSNKIDIRSLVIEADNELLEQGAKPFQRPLAACSMIANKLGTSFAIGGPPDPLVDAVHAIYERLYRKLDLLQPPLHVGVFMFRDVFIPIRIPIIYGQPGFSPVMLLNGELSEEQEAWLFSDQLSGYTFFDQVIDLMDFVYGLDDYLQLSGDASRAVAFWQIAKRQLEGAAATLFGSFDQQSIVQNSCIAVELLLKGALLNHGFTEKELKNPKTFGHSLSALAIEVNKCLPNIDGERIALVADRLPHLVANRYDGTQKSRRELGGIAMNAQYVAGEVLRQFSTRNLRSSFAPDGDWNFRIRHYPRLEG